MKNKKSLRYRILSWTLVIGGVLLLLFICQVVVLAYPQIFFHNRVQSGSVVLYYDKKSDMDYNQLAKAVSDRLAASSFNDSTQKYDVFYFQNENLYKLYCRLALITPQAQGFELSFLNNSYINAAQIKRLGIRSNRQPKYSIWEGLPAHTIAHEIGHLQITNLIGRKKWQNLPHWKQEGLPEYIANIALIRNDSTASLQNRLDLLKSSVIWIGWDRVHYEAGLLIEFLMDYKKYKLEDIMADSVIKEQTMKELLNWINNQSY